MNYQRTFFKKESYTTPDNFNKLKLSNTLNSLHENRMPGQSLSKVLNYDLFNRYTLYYELFRSKKSLITHLRYAQKRSRKSKSWKKVLILKPALIKNSKSKTSKYVLSSFIYQQFTAEKFKRNIDTPSYETVSSTALAGAFANIKATPKTNYSKLKRASTVKLHLLKSKHKPNYSLKVPTIDTLIITNNSSSLFDFKQPTLSDNYITQNLLTAHRVTHKRTSSLVLSPRSFRPYKHPKTPHTTLKTFIRSTKSVYTGNHTNHLLKQSEFGNTTNPYGSYGFKRYVIQTQGKSPVTLSYYSPFFHNRLNNFIANPNYFKPNRYIVWRRSHSFVYCNDYPKLLFRFIKKLSVYRYVNRKGINLPIHLYTNKSLFLKKRFVFMKRLHKLFESFSQHSNSIFDFKSNSYKHLKVYNNFTNNHINYVDGKMFKKRPRTEVKVSRIKFKPGYQRVWRKARLGFKEYFDLKFVYQKRLTSYLRKFYQIIPEFRFANVTLTLSKILLDSQLVPDRYTLNLFLEKNTVFLNTMLVKSLRGSAYVGDCIQILLTIQYYVSYRWLVNWNLNRLKRIKRLMFMKSKAYKYKLTKLRKQKSYYIPTWVKDYTQDTRSILNSYLEVDFLTLSAVIVYDYNLYGFLRDDSQNHYNHSTFRIYNWKYVT